MSTENTKTILLGGELTLLRAEEIKNLFLRCLSEAKNISIAFGAINDIDLSFLQLCCSLHRSAVRNKKQVRIEGTAPKALKEAAFAAGYIRLAGCKHDCDNGCLWVAVAGGAHRMTV